MSQISSFGAIPPQENTSNSQSSALQDVDLDQFLNLMIAELQNQDPLDPLDNSEMLQQITQIREIGASDKLSATLSAVLDGQNLTTASALIGQNVSALSDDLENIEGTVQRVSIEVDDDDNRSIKVHVGEHSVDLANIREIVKP